MSVGLGDVAGKPVEQQKLDAKRQIVRIAGSSLRFLGERHEILDEAFVFLQVAFEEWVFAAAHQFFFGSEIGLRVACKEIQYFKNTAMIAFSGCRNKVVDFVEQRSV